jgi:hypothetical protein
VHRSERRRCPGTLRCGRAFVCIPNGGEHLMCSFGVADTVEDGDWTQMKSNLSHIYIWFRLGLTSSQCIYMVQFRRERDKKREREVCYRGGQAIALERVTCPSFSSHIMRTR